MKNINDDFNSKREAKELARLYAQGKSMYSSRPFVQQHRMAFKASKLARALFGGFSVASGMSVVLAVADLPLWLVIPFVGALLLAVEFGKNYAISSACRALFNHKPAGAPIALAVVLFSLSVGLSTFGAFNAGEALKMARSEELATAQAGTAGEEEKAWDARIAEAQATADEYAKGNRVKVRNLTTGKWEQVVSDRASVKKAHGALMEQVANLQAQKAQAMASLSEGHSSQAEEALGKAETASWVIVGISAVNELFIVGLLYFCALYLYRAYEEPELARGMDSQEAQELVGLIDSARTPAVRHASTSEEAEKAYAELLAEHSALREEMQAMREQEEARGKQ